MSPPSPTSGEHDDDVDDPSPPRNGSSSSTSSSSSSSSSSSAARFEIHVSKDTFKFNASHFVAYRGFRERLHGHNYRASVRLIGSGGTIGGDGYVLDFGCVKMAVKDVCKAMNEYFIVPMLSDVLDIVVVEDDGDDEGAEGGGDDDDGGRGAGGEESAEGGGAGESTTTTAGGGLGKRRRARSTCGGGGTVTIACEDGSKFVFPRHDCLLLPIMHTTAEELAIYLYGKVLSKLNANYLVERGVDVMEVTVSEAVGQEASFRLAIPRDKGEGGGEDPFDVASYVRRGRIPAMPCATDTEGARRRGNKRP